MKKTPMEHVITEGGNRASNQFSKESRLKFTSFHPHIITYTITIITLTITINRKEAHKTMITTLISIIFYIASSLVFMFMLDTLGYQKPWQAWIPILNVYAATSVFYGTTNEGNVKLLNRIEVPVIFLKMHQVITILLNLIISLTARTQLTQLTQPVLQLLILAIQVICMGTIFTNLYAMLKRSTPEAEMLLGIISGLFPIIPILIIPSMCINQKDTLYRMNDYPFKHV